MDELIARGYRHNLCWPALNTLFKVYLGMDGVMRSNHDMELPLQLLDKCGALVAELSHGSCNWQVQSIQTQQPGAAQVTFGKSIASTERLPEASAGRAVPFRVIAILGKVKAEVDIVSSVPSLHRRSGALPYRVVQRVLSTARLHPKDLKEEHTDLFHGSFRVHNLWTTAN